MNGGETNGRKDERGGRLASLPALRRQNADAGSAAHGAGGFSAVLPKVQIHLRDSLSKRNNGRNQNAGRLDAVQFENFELRCVFQGEEHETMDQRGRAVAGDRRRADRLHGNRRAAPVGQRPVRCGRSRHISAYRAGMALWICASLGALLGMGGFFAWIRIVARPGQRDEEEQ